MLVVNTKGKTTGGEFHAPIPQYPAKIACALAISSEAVDPQ
jgi:hypothetical protein